MLAMRERGFTIVELLIVVVVIAILAAITVVAYNGISQRATASALQSDVSQAVKKIEAAKVSAADGLYPADQTAAGLSSSGGGTMTYTSTDGSSFCIETRKGTVVYSASSSASTVQAVGCDKNGLVGQWRLNGNANDSVGTKNGTVTGATLTTGRNGSANGAYSFNPANTAIITFADGYAVTALTKSLWMNVSATTTNYPTLFDFGTPGNSVYLELLSTGGVMSGVKALTGGNAFAGTSNESTTGALSLGQWVHVAQVISRTNMRLYINGVQATSRPGDYDLSAANQAFSLGGGRALYNGVLDDVRMYNRALSASDIQAVYAAGAE